MTGRGCCGRVAGDDDELDGLELPDVAANVHGGEVPLRLDDIDWEWGE